MVDFEIIIPAIAVTVSIIIFLITLIQRLSVLETKFDCLLIWVLEIDPTNGTGDKVMKLKRQHLKKQIEDTLNGDACKPPKA